MNQEQKIEAYKEGRYLMPVPPVTTTYWELCDWINFIDSHGVWL